MSDSGAGDGVPIALDLLSRVRVDLPRPSHATNDQIHTRVESFCQGQHHREQLTGARWSPRVARVVIDPPNSAGRLVVHAAWPTEMTVGAVDVASASWLLRPQV
ncbi:hypothetical protein GCM10009603_55020 [Nocardiopsis exhalans]